MTLIKCDECGKEISSKASICPHCGNPMKSTQNKTVRIKTICGEGIFGGGFLSKQTWTVFIDKKYVVDAGGTFSFEIDKPFKAYFVYSHKEFQNFYGEIKPGKNYMMKLESGFHLFGKPYLSEVTNIDTDSPWS